MVLITSRQRIAEGAQAKVPEESGPHKSALLDGQTMRAHPELHQSSQPSDGQRVCAERVCAELVGAAKPMMICTKLGPRARCGPWGYMQPGPYSTAPLRQPGHDIMAFQSPNACRCEGERERDLLIRGSHQG